MEGAQVGEAKLRQPEIDAIKVQAEQDAANIQQLAHFTADAATFVNGVFATVLENGTVRVTFHEAVHRALPPKPRAALMMTAQTAKNVAEILGRIVKAIDEQNAGDVPHDVGIIPNDDQGTASGASAPQPAAVA